MTFKGIASKFVAAGKDFKSEILKAAEKAPMIAAEVEKDAPEVRSADGKVFPRRRRSRAGAIDAFEAILDAVEAAGPAAAQNRLSVTLDKALVASIQGSMLPKLKAFAAKL